MKTAKSPTKRAAAAKDLSAKPRRRKTPEATPPEPTTANTTETIN
jgi:hypothetical protein